MSQDREFESYMQGKSGLSDLYAGLPQVKAPDHLDAAILAEAHRAVGARPGGKPKRRWIVPLSMVASLFVAVMIGLQLPYLVKDPAVAQAPRQERMDVAAPEKRAAAPAPVAQEEKPARMQARERLEVAPVPVAPRTAAPPPPEVESRMAAPPAAAPPAPAVAADQEQVSGRVEFEAARAHARAKKSAASVQDTGGRPEPSAPAPATMAAPEPLPMAAEAKPTANAEAGGASQRPEDWLARIKQLKQQGKLEEARKEMAAFRKRYPDYPVPKDLEIH